MGTYCTTSGLEIVMIGTSFNTATSAMASKCITWAENEINKYLSERYDLSGFDSLTSTPPIVTSLCEQISIGYFHLNNSRGGKEARDRGKDLLENAITNLKLYQKGEAELIDSSGNVIDQMSNTSYAIRSNTTDYSSTFNEDDPIFWSVDSDKLTAIEDDRK